MRLNEICLQDDGLQKNIDKGLSGVLAQVIIDGNGTIFFDIDKQNSLLMRLIAIISWWKQVIAYSKNLLIDELEMQDFSEDDFTIALALLLLLLEEYVSEEEENFVTYWDQDSCFQRNFRKDGYTGRVEFVADIKMIFKMVFEIVDRSNVTSLLDERWLSIWRYLGLTIGETRTSTGEMQSYSAAGCDDDYTLTWH